MEVSEIPTTMQLKSQENISTFLEDEITVVHSTAASQGRLSSQELDHLLAVRDELRGHTISLRTDKIMRKYWNNSVELSIQKLSEAINDPLALYLLRQIFRKNDFVVSFTSAKKQPKKNDEIDQHSTSSQEEFFLDDQDSFYPTQNDDNTRQHKKPKKSRSKRKRKAVDFTKFFEEPSSPLLFSRNLL
mmetsp:Transcript_2376/g.2658  ORF Transcript_2376/g.2658 Transcript_2376/m.2658 type:complete len:188 (-) Transcript_2376:4-567(-)